jgi:integrase/recombinase XerD
LQLLTKYRLIRPRRRTVQAVMATAALDASQASPKGLRHTFGVAAVPAGIPLYLVQSK